MHMSEFHDILSKHTVKYIDCSLKWYIIYACVFNGVMFCTFKTLRALLLRCASYDVMLILGLFSMLFYVVSYSENRLKIDITPYGEKFIIEKFII